MISRKNNSSAFTLNLLLASICLAIFSVLFTVYILAEKRIDSANELRHQSFLLANELRQSSDDLTRAVRTYVASSDPIYKQYYSEIIDIRNGKLPRKPYYHIAYWDNTQNNQPLNLGAGQAVPLMELIHKAGFSEKELAKLAEAKEKSDKLTTIEFAAMALFETSKHAGDEAHLAALRILHDDIYNQAKAEIMRPISDCYRMMEERTSDLIKSHERLALNIRYTVILVGFILIFLLWRTYQSMRSSLGAPLEEVQSQIARIGSIATKLLSAAKILLSFITLSAVMQ
jgi:hypothetical protein